MLILISPTKQMKTNTQMVAKTIPKLVRNTNVILSHLKELSVEEVMRLMKVKEAIAKENVERFQKMKFDLEGTPALYTYDGLQFKHMLLEQLDEDGRMHLYNSVRILSGFYGVVEPMDSIYPYRLEMQAGLTITDMKNMYEYWGATLANHLEKEVSTHVEPLLLNLASKEYEKAVRPHLQSYPMITVTFKIEKDGKLKTESTQVKMARGAMIYFLGNEQISTLDGVKKFQESGYCYDERLSSKEELVFVKRG